MLSAMVRVLLAQATKVQVNNTNAQRNKKLIDPSQVSRYPLLRLELRLEFWHTHLPKHKGL